MDGRRWRATDPGIPAALRAELVAELMAARRAVGAGKRASDDDAVAAARRRVHDAKVALGERGAPWWEPASPESTRARISATTMTLLRHRAATASICPSDVARAVGGHDWRERLGTVRTVAAQLAADRVLSVTQGDEPIAIDDVSGPVRLRRGPAFEGGAGSDG